MHGMWQPLELSSSSPIFPLLRKSSSGYLHNMSTFELNSSSFPESPCGLHCAQILSIPAHQLSLKRILSTYGSESLEEHVWKSLWCRVAQFLPEIPWWIQEPDGGILERNLLMPLKVEYLSAVKYVLTGCQWLMAAIILSYFCEEAGGWKDIPHSPAAVWPKMAWPQSSLVY